MEGPRSLMGPQAGRQETPGCQVQEILNHTCGKKEPPRIIGNGGRSGAGRRGATGGQTPKISLHKALVLC